MDRIRWKPPEDFDQVAGKIVSEMRGTLLQRKYLSQQEQLKIAAELDAWGKVKPIEVLPPNCRRELAAHNQKNQSLPIDTFVKAMKASEPECLREKILKRLYRAEKTFKERERLRLSQDV
jgi:hypothetical protein